MSDARPGIAALAAVGLLAAGCVIHGWDDRGEYRAEATQELTVAAAGLESFSCTTHNGYLTVVGVPDATEVRVVATIVARGPTQEDADLNVTGVQVTQEVSGNELQLGWEWSEPRSRQRWASISYRIEAPPHLAADVTTHNGEISVSAWRGDLRGETHNGNVTVQGELAVVEVETHNGGVIARLDGTGPVNGGIRTHNGSVELQVGEQVASRIIATTHNGGVSYSGALEWVEAGRNFLVGGSGDASGRLRVATHNGAVRIR